MNQNRFDALTRILSSVPSRRHLLRGLASAGLGFVLGAVPLSGIAEAKKKRKHKKKGKKRKPKVKFNAFGCVNVGRLCKDASQCCSGICEGEPGQKTCVAHDTGGCPAGVDELGCGDPGTDVPCTSSTGKTEGYACNTTTGNAAFCAFSSDCFPCRKDAECQEQFPLSQIACIRCTACPETGGTACAYA